MSTIEQVEVVKYQPYPEYKDSGVEWLGEVPIEWRKIRVGHLFIRIKRTGYQEQELLSVYRDYGVVPKNSRDDNNNRPSDDLSAYQLVKPSDLVLNKMKTWQGSIAISNYEGIVSPAYFVYTPVANFKSSYHAQYLHYLLRSPVYISQYLRSSKGIRINQWDLDPDLFKTLEILFPPLREQRTIAAFLDYETARIDKLISQQQRLIELLIEKRKAVISHAVTKGLNPDAPMKDSGVEWLGGVPELWSVGRIGYYCRIENGTTPSKLNQDYWSDGSIPWLSSGAVNQYEITEASEMISAKALAECSLRLLPKNTLVVGMIGQGKTRGMSAITRISASINQNLAAIIPNEKISSDFLHFVLQAAYVALRETGRGGNQAALNCELIAELRFAKPDLDTQLKIVRYLKKKCIRFDKIIAHTNTSIELLQERRTALISAAVTGKIDLRDWDEPIKEVAA